MIAFDLDGVFLGDITFSDDDERDNMLHVRVNNINPTFIPTGDYYIITGRPVQDKDGTLAWIAKKFSNPPKEVFHESHHFGTEHAINYKVAVIKDHPEIITFVESDKEQAVAIGQQVDCNVICFTDLINEGLK